ncbi:tripartite tricarboxylate transporter TctB family protein [uncultured Jannaschia sp.]|uniref:tripartite tricarboxylate transporter TctB family protein n=1 Tax=uncultured Jannaschia sp. TaxID=293347 RepID=UPI002638326F|nr:tripartite tricarboxylate transporter TctB family protein [uncultured Jannaschia sp.]
MRRAEITTAGVLALLSIYMMWKSTELQIGYIRGSGPGGGFWPFWLSAIMLLCTVLIAINGVRRKSPPSQTDEPFLDGFALKNLVFVGGALVAFLLLISVVGMHIAIFLFLIYYVGFLGRHSFVVTASLAIGVPIAFFFFFDGLMRIPMPTGMAFTNPLYDVLYGLIY